MTRRPVRTVLLWSFLTGPLAAQDTAWFFRDVSIRPSARSGRTLTFLEHLGKALLFSNTSSNDTWEWNGSSWTQLSPATSPPIRIGAALVYDPNRRVSVLFGGGVLAPTDETWEWIGTNWAQKNPVQRPIPRSDHAMVFDPIRQRVVLFGGLDNRFGRFLDDTWTWDGTDWTQVATGNPPGRYQHAMAFDEARGVVVLFGGGSSQTLFNDTWEWDGTVWRDVTRFPAPRSRVGHAMAYHAVRQRVILFAGHTMFGGGVVDETWEWNGVSRTWVPLFPLSTPGPKWLHGMVYDRWRSRMIVFGGYNNFAPVTDETWTFSEIPLTAWPADPTPGQTIILLLNSVRDPGAGYLLGCSFSRVPGIPILPDGRVISLGPDPLLFWSMGSLTPPFLGFQGGLSASGWAQASILLPGEQALAGVRFFVSGFVYDAQGVRTVLNEVELRVRSS